jgi:ABC-2 type transport system ATP-binding protein
MVEVRNLTKKYSQNYAINDISFICESGKITGFVGENGAGKSTTINILLNIVRQNSGAALIDGKQYKEYNTPAKKVGSALDYKVGLPNLTAKDYLLSIAKVYKIKKEKVIETLDSVGLGQAHNKKIKKFSLGMNQRLTIATAILTDPDTLILDEPFNGIDPKGIRWLKELLLDYKRQGKTVLLSSHQLADVAQICDKVVIISKGKIVKAGDVNTIISSSAENLVINVSSPDINKLSDLLVNNQNVTVENIGENSISVSGLSMDQISDIAFKNNVKLSELSKSSDAFEKTYLDLVGSKEK